MNVLKLTQNAQLGPLIEASQAEGFNFVMRSQLELAQGDFKKPGAALYGFVDNSFIDGDLLGDKLAGVGGLTSDPYLGAEPEVGRLRHLYVLPQYRRQGVGQKLVTAIVAEAKRHYDVLRLRTTTREAARFYEALGFRPVTEPNATHRLDLR